MTKFELKLESDNDAFSIGDPADEVTWLLTEVINHLDNGRLSGQLRDSNGNTIGHFALTNEEED